MNKYLLIACLFSLNLYAQTPNPGMSPGTNREAYAAQQQLNELKIRLAELKKEAEEKKQAAAEAVAKAEESARASTEASTRLSQNIGDKSLSSEAKKLNRESKRLDRAAQRAGKDVADIEEKITSLEKQLAEAEQRVAFYTSTQTAATSPAGRIEAAPAIISSSGNVTLPASPQARTSTPPTPEALPQVAQRVVEQTYKNYPQQPGQPAIIINNIIVPSDYYNKSGSVMPAGTSGSAARDVPRATEVPQLSEQDWREFEAYRAWLHNKRTGRARQAEAYTDAYPETYEARGHKLTFKERFGELSARKSGVWVIPRIGLHASNFEADFRNNEATGRSGWNAGIDLRAHANRFFFQPGVHYFNTSLDLTSKDSLNNVSLTSGPKIHSLKVPLLVGLYLTKAQDAFLKFNIRGGVVGNYVMSVDKTANSDFRKDNLEKYTYGLNAGIGIELGLITIDLSHEWGMNSMFKNTDVKNNVLRATLGVKL